MGIRRKDNYIYVTVVTLLAIRTHLAKKRRLHSWRWSWPWTLKWSRKYGCTSTSSTCFESEPMPSSQWGCFVKWRSEVGCDEAISGVPPPAPEHWFPGPNTRRMTAHHPHPTPLPQFTHDPWPPIDGAFLLRDSSHLVHLCNTANVKNQSLEL